MMKDPTTPHAQHIATLGCLFCTQCVLLPTAILTTKQQFTRVFNYYIVLVYYVPVVTC